MDFGQRVLDFKLGLRPDWKLPPGFDLLYPFREEATRQAMQVFYRKYYADDRPRTFLFSINPGRFGSGVTGVAFTDPIRLQEQCGIDNPFPKKPELSSQFIYDMIDAYGGPTAFYRQFYFIAVCPLGFTFQGKNCNYYDDPRLLKAAEPHILQSLQTQLSFGANRHTAVCIGQGKNLQYLEKLNARHGFFERILPLPHPRWVMQYRRKRKEEFVGQYLGVLG